MLLSIVSIVLENQIAKTNFTNLEKKVTRYHLYYKNGHLIPFIIHILIILLK